MLKLIKNFSYTISSNLLNFIVVALVTLIVPKLIGVREYGFWQLYLFYTNYVGILHLGWLDGIYLKYGGANYEDLNNNYFKTQFFYFVIFQGIVAVIIALYGLLFCNGSNQFVVISVAVYMIFLNLRQFFLYLLQDTDRIKEYAENIIFDRVFYVLWVIVFLVAGVRNFKALIIGDIASKAITLALVVIVCRSLFTGKVQRFAVAIKNIYQNVSIGIKLLVANFASLLIVGIVRFAIKSTWGVTVFGKVSLTLSISNAMMLFVTAISLVLFPTLRRIDRALLSNLYDNFRQILILILFLCMFLYFPLITLISRWLPNYRDALKYLAFLFPMFIYEGKFELMVNTFMKTVRMEKSLLMVNLCALTFSLILTAVNVFCVRNLNLIMLSIIIILWFRSNLGEFVISKHLRLRVVRNMAFETAFVVLFIYLTWYLKTMLAFLLFVIVFAVYVTIFWKKIINSFNYIKSIV